MKFWGVALKSRLVERFFLKLIGHPLRRSIWGSDVLHRLLSTRKCGGKDVRLVHKTFDMQLRKNHLTSIEVGLIHHIQCWILSLKFFTRKWEWVQNETYPGSFFVVWHASSQRSFPSWHVHHIDCHKGKDLYFLFYLTHNDEGLCYDTQLSLSWRRKSAEYWLSGACAESDQSQRQPTIEPFLKKVNTNPSG